MSAATTDLRDRSSASEHEADLRARDELEGEPVAL